MSSAQIGNWYCERCKKTIAAVEMVVQGKHWCRENRCGGKTTWIRQEVKPLEEESEKGDV